MENLMEMEYVINGEKYLVTVTKVEETNNECTNCTCELENEPIDLSSVLPEFELENEETDGTIVSVANIPDGISLTDWLKIIKEYNIILTK
jgi:hypothetical protein